jgi:hypothetical protein
MAIRIRVYPQYGGLGMNRFGMNGLGMQGGAVSASTYYNSKLTTQRQVSSLQLGYERALANERIERARLEERMKNPYAVMGGFGGQLGGYGYSPVASAYNPYAASMLGSSLLGSSSGFFGSLGLGGLF